MNQYTKQKCLLDIFVYMKLDIVNEEYHTIIINIVHVTHFYIIYIYIYNNQQQLIYNQY